MFFLLSKTLDLALSPVSWAIALLVLALAMWTRRVRLARVAVLAALGVLVLFSLEIISNGLMRSLETPSTRTEQPNVTYDAVLLLGGLVEDHATEDHALPAYSDAVERLLTTYDLLRTGRARVAVISGGPPDESSKQAEADILAEQLYAWGIAKDRVIVDRSAHNTRDNAVETSRIARARGFQRLLVVTSAFHMPRALGCYRAVGLPVDALPVDYRSFDPARHRVSWQPRAVALNQSAVALRELAGGVVYQLLGYSR